jgi:hypothetical protein
MKKQQGTSSDDLWVAYWVAARTDQAAGNLLEARAKHAAWKNVIEPLRLSSEILGERPENALRANAPDSRLAETVVDELFLQDKLLGEGDLLGLRQAGASNQELILAVMIATKTRQSAKRLYLEVKNGTKTWGGLLNEAKIDTRNMQQEISAILRLQPMISDNSSR